ncbi:ABC transporter substrate-binding protein [Paenarthrobacter sp. 22069]|uniref:ABC transporter substrate-binding protein n=1 Tax=Paenarthrobacter sp. 22069 TaxID=3453864 RepID=UPI003F83D94E
MKPKAHLVRSGTVLTLAAVMFSLSACSGGGGTPSSGEATTTLKLGVGAAPASFDPAQIENNGNALELAQPVYDSLLHRAPNGDIQPWLAKDWKYNDNKTQLTLDLRDDVTFSDGTKFDAKSAADNLNRFKSRGGPQASMLADVSNVAATDADTVTLTLAQPNPALASYLTTVAGLQVSPASFDNPSLATEPAGSGPYKLDTSATTSGSIYTYIARDNYWNKDAVKFNKIEIRVLTDPSAMANAFASGQIDAGPAGVTNLDQFKGSGAQVDTVEGDWAGFMMFDRTGKLSKPLGDVRVRQAFNMALDKEALLQTLQKGLGTVTTQIFSPEDPGYVPELDKKYSHDPQQAKKLLADAGYPDGIDITMVAASVTPADVLSVYAQQLAEAGIRVTWETQDINAFLSTMFSGKSAINPMQLGAKGGWEMINQLVAPNAPWNPLKDQTPELEAMIKDVQFAADDAARATAVKKVNTYLVDNAWFAPWYRLASPYAFKADHVGVEMQYQQTLPSIYNFKPAS